MLNGTHDAAVDDAARAPCDLDAEAAVLSAVLLDPDALPKVAGLRPEDFYSEAHRRIFEAVLEVHAKGSPVDSVLVATCLRDRERLAQVGGLAYLTEVLNAAPAVANVGAYADVVTAKARARKMIAQLESGAAQIRMGLDADTVAASLEIHRPKSDGPPLVSAPASWYSDAPPKRAWLLRDARHPKARGVLPLGKVGQLIAAGGSGKTMAVCQLAVAVNTATPWLGALAVASPGRVLLVLGEEDGEESQRRLYRAARAANARPSADGIVVIPLQGVHAPMLETDARGHTTEAPFLLWLRDYIRGGDFRLVVIDPLSRFAGREAETDNAAGTRFVQACESVTPSTTSLLIAHHTNQTSRKSGDVDATAGRGVTALVDGPRWQCALVTERLKLDDAEERERLGEVVTFAVTKSNYAARPEPILLRRDQDNGGALVPVDDDDVATIGEARGQGTPERRTEEREAARKTSRQQRETELQTRAASRQAAKEADRARAAASATAILAGEPGITVRDLRARVKADARVGSETADVGIALAKARGKR